MIITDLPIVEKIQYESISFLSEMLDQEKQLPSKQVLQCPSILPRRYVARNYTYGMSYIAGDYPTSPTIRVAETLPLWRHFIIFFRKIHTAFATGHHG